MEIRVNKLARMLCKDADTVATVLSSVLGCDINPNTKLSIGLANSSMHIKDFYNLSVRELREYQKEIDYFIDRKEALEAFEVALIKCRELNVPEDMIQDIFGRKELQINEAETII